MNRIRSRRTIHVQIKQPRSFPSKSSRSKLSEPVVSFQKRFYNDRKIDSTQCSNESLPNPYETSTFNLNRSSIQLRNDLTKPNGLSDDHHRNKKKKQDEKFWRRRLIIVSLIIAIISIIILSVTLSLMLTRKETKERFRAPAVLQWNTTGIPIAGLGSEGGVSNNLIGPHGFTWDSSGLLYIVEHWGHRVTAWKPGAINGTIIAGLVNTTFATTLDAFHFPVDIFVESNGSIYVTDGANKRLQYWSKGSSSGVTVAGLGSNISVVLPVPYSIVRDPTSNSFFISTILDASIVEYPSGIVVAGGNGIGNASHQLNSPEGLVYDQFTHSFIIANGGSHTIARWNYAAQNGTILFGKSGNIGNSSNTFNRPMGLAIDPMGNIYVADYGNHRIQLFMNGETDGRTILGMTGVPGSTSSLFYNPIAIKLDNHLNIFISDHANGRIMKFHRY